LEVLEVPQHLLLRSLHKIDLVVHLGLYLMRLVGLIIDLRCFGLQGFDFLLFLAVLSLVCKNLVVFSHDFPLHFQLHSCEFHIGEKLFLGFSDNLFLHRLLPLSLEELVVPTPHELPQPLFPILFLDVLPHLDGLLLPPLHDLKGLLSRLEGHLPLLFPLQGPPQLGLHGFHFAKLQLSCFERLLMLLRLVH